MKSVHLLSGLISEDSMDRRALQHSRVPCDALPCQDALHAAAWSFMNGTDIEGGGVEWKNLSIAIDQGLATARPA